MRVKHYNPNLCCQAIAARNLIPSSCLAKCSELVKNGDFQGKNTSHWSEYRPASKTHANANVVLQNQSGFITAHLHGNCPTTAGGLQQTIATSVGTSYLIKFKAFSGHWDGIDRDSVVVRIVLPAPSTPLWGDCFARSVG